MEKVTVGLLAHVDAGKTTLSEAILYESGCIRRLGRVDKRDAHLDTNPIEQERGITIFSKEARLVYEGKEITLLDTPGHVDFSAEMERTLRVLDYAVLVISGTDGVQGHTHTLWRLLKRYRIPVFLFINKMDRADTDKDALLLQLKEQLSPNCVACGEETQAFYEEAAVCEESALEQYLETGKVSQEKITRMVLERKMFPCYFGSALQLTGISAFLQGFCAYTAGKAYPLEFGAKVFKITRDEKNNRLTHMKITGGTLCVRDVLSKESERDRAAWEEKVSGIRVYNGTQLETAKEVSAGEICVCQGLTQTYAGQGLGVEKTSALPLLEPVLTYQIELPPDCSAAAFLPKLRSLEEEEPELKLVWDETHGQIQAQLMGEVQTEVLRRLIWERFAVDVHFGAGQIVYKETIANRVEGVGHFEPLRHYAEVHLLLEPGEPGSGVQAASVCSEDSLDKNWQRLVCTHILEKAHAGVLLGAELTDVKITLVAGKAHLKHTEGGDFRQATYRAVRQGLMKAESVLLEPYYEYRLEVPPDTVGRAMTDLERFFAVFDPPVQEGAFSVLQGTAPVATMQNYQQEVQSYTKGLGRLSCVLKGYFPCHNRQEVLAAADYDPELDEQNTASSVFCSHGAGFSVPWQEVERYMHLPLTLAGEKMENLPQEWQAAAANAREEIFLGEDEVQGILKRASGANRNEGKNNPYKKTQKRTVSAVKPHPARQPSKPKEKYLLVDGYNIIYAWEELSALARTNIDAAREKLMDIMCNYQGYVKCVLLLVFDAYRVKEGMGRVKPYHNIYVVYTREAETADQYIEKLAHKIGREYDVTVATSDGLEQLIIRGQGCKLISSREFHEEVRRVERNIKERIEDFNTFPIDIP